VRDLSDRCLAVIRETDHRATRHITVHPDVFINANFGVPATI
jgi:hypothetical protein